MGDSPEPGIELRTVETRCTAVFSQTVACKPGRFYRIEVDVRCSLNADSDGGGFVLEVEPVGARDDAVAGRRTAPILHSGEDVSVRTYYESPAGVRRLRVSLGVRDASGSAYVSAARLILILEPDEASHPLAVPTPAHSHPAPKRVGSACVCSESAGDRPITKRLREFLGPDRCSTLPPDELTAESIHCDALFLPDAVAPRSIRKVADLLRLARQRVVVVSLSAFARLSRGAAAVRRVAQKDDPIHGEVAFTGYATTGFALQDTFPFAWKDDRADFVQNQYRKTPRFETFCKKYGLVTLLRSTCDREVTSNRACALFKATDGGGLFVLDIEPVEQNPSTMGEPVLAMHLLLALLGHPQATAGQFIIPVRKERHFRELIREAGARFDGFVVHDDDLPIEEVLTQLVTLGREDLSFGLPLRSKPVLLVRSGLRSGDVESVYGAFLWFKHLIRPHPHASPQASVLAAEFRLAWVPCAAPWEARDGWSRMNLPPLVNSMLDVEDGSLGAMIDVVSAPLQEVRVVLPSEEGDYSRLQSWLPDLYARPHTQPYYSYLVDSGDDLGDRTRFGWRFVSTRLEVAVEPNAFDSDIHREAMKNGAKVLRIELPGGDFDFPAQSIYRTHVAVTVLEHVAGMLYDLSAARRGMRAESNEIGRVRAESLQPIE